MTYLDDEQSTATNPAPQRGQVGRAGDVAIVIPTLNEAAHIGDLLDSMVRQAPDRVAEILVVDGGSTDGTRAMVSANTDPRVRLIENPARLQSAGMNLAANQAASGVTTLIRVDAHARYGDDFIDQLLAAQAESGAQSVVNRVHSIGVAPLQRAVAAASNSSFGTGGAAHRSSGASGFIDHGHHALFERATYLALGGYDEGFVANEDAEYDTRLRQAGGRIWFTDHAVVEYYPRATLRALGRQYFRYGRGRGKTRTKHGEKLRPRQLIPPALAVTLGVTTLAGLAFPAAFLVPAGYCAGVAAATAVLIVRTRDLAVWRAVLVLPVMHLAWGCGFLIETVSRRR